MWPVPTWDLIGKTRSGVRNFEFLKISKVVVMTHQVGGPPG